MLVAQAMLVQEEASWTGYGFMRFADAAVVADGLRTALAALDGSDDPDGPELRAELLSRLPRVLHFGTEPAERLALAEEAHKMAVALGQPRLRGAAAEALRWALWGMTDIERLAEVSEQVTVEALGQR